MYSFFSRRTGRVCFRSHAIMWFAFSFPIFVGILSAASAQTCTNNSERMISVKINLQQCLDGYGGSSARHKIIFGRYNGSYSPMVKQGFGECQSGKPGQIDFDSCDEASFWIAANDLLPLAEYIQHPEAKTIPDSNSDISARVRLCTLQGGKLGCYVILGTTAACTCADGQVGTVLTK